MDSLWSSLFFRIFPKLILNLVFIENYIELVL